MSDPLTVFEFALLAAILDQHKRSIRIEESELSNLAVISREPTGVGCYVSFSKEAQRPGNPLFSGQFGFEGEIRVPGVPSGLGAVLDVESGRLNHIELFTYGSEKWDGDTSTGEIVPASL